MLRNDDLQIPALTAATASKIELETSRQTATRSSALALLMMSLTSRLAIRRKVDLRRLVEEEEIGAPAALF